MEMRKLKGKDLFVESLQMASVMATNKDNTLQVMYQRQGNQFLCIIKKYGSKTSPNEAVLLTANEYIKSFKKCVLEGWFFNMFTKNKIITWR